MIIENEESDQAIQSSDWLCSVIIDDKYWIIIIILASQMTYLKLSTTTSHKMDHSITRTAADVEASVVFQSTLHTLRVAVTLIF